MHMTYTNMKNASFLNENYGIGAVLGETAGGSGSG